MAPHIRGVATLLLIFFLIVAGNLAYWQIFRAPDIKADPVVNRYRNVQAEQMTQRGAIVDRSGVLLVNTQKTPDGSRRLYVAPWVAPITGFHSVRFGNTGLEATYNDYLVGTAGLDAWTTFMNKLMHRQQPGNNLVLTIDSHIQQVAEQAMGDSQGAVIALDPKTGAILALVSHPNYDATNIDKTWDQIKDNPGHPLLNHATQGLYVPGSTFKTVTAAAGLDLGIVSPDTPEHLDRKLDKYGRYSVTKIICGAAIYDANVDRNDFNFTYAYAKSSNSVFATLGYQLGANNLIEYARRFGWERQIPLGIPVSVSQIQTDPNYLKDCGAVAVTAFGQGQLLATPLQMALVSAAVANGGTIMQPYLVDRVQTHDGKTIMKNQPRQWSYVMRPETAHNLANMMVAGVDYGYANWGAIPGVKVGGKTGTAETGIDGLSHAWYIGFAPLDNPKIAVAVIKENAGQGGSESGPVAKAVMEAALGLR